jgi:hypothetical protein
MYTAGNDFFPVQYLEKTFFAFEWFYGNPNKKSETQTKKSEI